MASIDELKTKQNLTRTDIAKLLKSIGPPGKNREAKIKAVQELEKSNFQGHGLHETLESYLEF